MCETRVKESIRLMPDWEIAPRMPTTMVASAAIISRVPNEPVGNSRVCTRMIA